jgi:hypothetical protein
MERSCWQDSYDWARQWYALAFVDYLDPKVPHAKELLGVRLVLWKDGEGRWRCFEDKCPHRLAPLSGLDLVHSAFESGKSFWQHTVSCRASPMHLHNCLVDFLFPDMQRAA